jgi:hypothetical protein
MHMYTLQTIDDLATHWATTKSESLQMVRWFDDTLGHCKVGITADHLYHFGGTDKDKSDWLTFHDNDLITISGMLNEALNYESNSAHTKSDMS